MLLERPVRVGDTIIADSRRAVSVLETRHRPVWYMPLEEAIVDDTEFPIHAITQRPMAMYHSWGTQNAWLRQIFNRNWLYMSRERATGMGLKDGDWVHVTSHHSRIKVQLTVSGLTPSINLS